LKRIVVLKIFEMIMEEHPNKLSEQDAETYRRMKWKQWGIPDEDVIEVIGYY